MAIMIASYSTSTTLILILLYNTCNQYYAFTFTSCPQFSFSRNRHRKPKGYACARHKIVLDASDNNASDQDDDGLPEIPCLPPIGGSSFNGEPAMDSEMIRLDGTSHDVNHVGTEKFELQYTCKVCETRNSHRVSRMAYRNGIVIAVCKGCMSKHLIADNLGWTKYIGGFDGDTNIEEFMKTMGRADEVHRVSQEVFDLEMILKDNGVNANSLSSDGTNSFE